MAIETGIGGTTYTGEHVNLFAMNAIASGLVFEIQTGMRMTSRGSYMNAANAWSGSNKRTKRGALIDLIAFVEKEFPGFVFSARIKDATKKA